MSRTTNFPVPVASGPSSQSTIVGHTGPEWVMPSAGDVPHQCPAKGSTQATFGEYPSIYLPITWQPNWSFRMGLKFDHIGASQSNILVYLREPQSKKRFQIHPDVYYEMMTKSTWVYGLVVEDWTWEKRGRYIYLCPTYI
ncbi:MAG: hypothetical protein WC761_01070 [Candidatus Paceibacterota bacterium]|jgi:hypothetical protein